jgi:hypothetical protein
MATAQFVRAIQYLGLEAELVPACTTMSHQNGTATIDIGVWEHPPVMRDDGTINGHAILWAESFKRCIDLGLCNHPAALKLFSEDPSFAIPVVVPMRGKAQLVDQDRRNMFLRKPFGIYWTTFPHWVSSYDPFLLRHANAITQGGLALANVAVDLLSALAVFTDLSDLGRLYPQLADLISGRASLPQPDSESASLSYRVAALIKISKGNNEASAG